MNIVLWILQVVLALAFLMAGGAKLTQPIPQLSKRMSWAAELPQIQVRLIGLAEVLGAIGLILPLATGILPWLTVAAAIGLGIIMVSAAIFHLTRNEGSHTPANIVFLVLALVIIIGRLVIVPIA